MLDAPWSLMRKFSDSAVGLGPKVSGNSSIRIRGISAAIKRIIYDRKALPTLTKDEVKGNSL